MIHDHGKTLWTGHVRPQIDSQKTLVQGRAPEVRRVSMPHPKPARCPGAVTWASISIGSGPSKTSDTSITSYVFSR